MSSRYTIVATVRDREQVGDEDHSTTMREDLQTNFADSGYEIVDLSVRQQRDKSAEDPEELAEPNASNAEATRRRANATDPEDNRSR
jgi:3-dehydroquinate dehydratase